MINSDHTPWQDVKVTTNTGTIVGTISTGAPIYATSTTTAAPIYTTTTMKVTVQPETKTKPTEKEKEKENLFKNCSYIADVVEHVPKKVYEFVFKKSFCNGSPVEGKHIKTVRAEQDPFNFDYAIYLALAKCLYKEDLTFEGILKKAEWMQYQKCWAKEVAKVKKAFFKKKELEIKEKAEEEQRKRRHEKYVAKKKRRDARRAEEANEGLKRVITEAIKESKEVK